MVGSPFFLAGQGFDVSSRNDPIGELDLLRGTGPRLEQMIAPAPQGCNNMHSATMHIRRTAMKASVLDLRYRMSEVLKALDRRERVSLYYHGKIKCEIVPAAEEQVVRTMDHPFFGMESKEAESVGVVMDKLR